MPKKKFILFCEGKNTEPEYFAALRQTLNRTLVDVEAHPGVGVPLTIAKHATAELNRIKRAKNPRNNIDSFVEEDEVWAVFDRDTHPKFDDAVKRCTSAGVGVATSDPCFELWLILHFQDYDAACNSRNAQAELKKVCKDYEPNGRKTANCHEFINAVEDAEVRAEKQLARRKKERSPFGNPSTTIFTLTRAIRNSDEG